MCPPMLSMIPDTWDFFGDSEWQVNKRDINSTSIQTGKILQLLHMFIQSFFFFFFFTRCCVSSQCAHSQEGKMICQTRKQHRESLFGEGPRDAGLTRENIPGWYATIGTATTVWPGPHWQIEFTVAYRWQKWSNKHQRERRRGRNWNKNHYGRNPQCTPSACGCEGSAGRMGNRSTPAARRRVIELIYVGCLRNHVITTAGTEPGNLSLGGNTWMQW